VTANSEVPRIWFNPPKFWAATKNMRKEETEELVNQLLRMAANRKFDRLREYDFISVGTPERAKRAS